MGLQLRTKTPKRRVKAKLREDRAVAMRRNEIWAMDFVHDQLATSRKLRILTVVDLFSRFSPVIDPAFSYKGSDVVETLERVCREMGYPKAIRVDQDELENARWFTREEMRDMLKRGTIKIPFKLAISYHLIKNWFDAGDLGPLKDNVDT